MVRGGAGAEWSSTGCGSCATRKGSAAAIRLQQAAIDAYRAATPASPSTPRPRSRLVRHLNAFGGTGAACRPTRVAERDQGQHTGRAARDDRWLRRQGATVCLNHPMVGSGDAADLAARLIRTNGMGAQVMEVGTADEPRRPDASVRHRRPQRRSY